MRISLETKGALIGARIGGKVTRCAIIGTLSSVSNKVLVKTLNDGKIFAIRPNLVTWINEELI